MKFARRAHRQPYLQGEGGERAGARTRDILIKSHPENAGQRYGHISVFQRAFHAPWPLACPAECPLLSRTWGNKPSQTSLVTPKKPRRKPLIVRARRHGEGAHGSDHRDPGDTRRRRREVPDGLVNGLYLVCQPSGARSWAVRYRTPPAHPQAHARQLSRHRPQVGPRGGPGRASSRSPRADDPACDEESGHDRRQGRRTATSSRMSPSNSSSATPRPTSAPGRRRSAFSTARW